MKILICFLLACPGFQGLLAQKKVTEIGPSLGFSIPVMQEKSPVLDRPAAGAIFGIHLNMLQPTGNSKIFLGTGFRVLGFYFNFAPTQIERKRALGLFGLSLAVPLNAHFIFPFDRRSAFRASLGILPIMETSALVRTDEPDGGIRFNIGTEAYIGLLLNRQSSIGFSWFMPLRLYGAKADSYTFYLQNFCFNISYCFKNRRFGK